jgi:hypothetical protein
MLVLTLIMMTVGTNVVLTAVVMRVNTAAGAHCSSDDNVYSCYYGLQY